LVGTKNKKQARSAKRPGLEVVRGSEEETPSIHHRPC
jgi:hypothetical protein